MLFYLAFGVAAWSVLGIYWADMFHVLHWQAEGLLPSTSLPCLSQPSSHYLWWHFWSACHHSCVVVGTWDGQAGWFSPLYLLWDSATGNVAQARGATLRGLKKGMVTDLNVSLLLFSSSTMLV